MRRTVTRFCSIAALGVMALAGPGTALAGPPSVEIVSFAEFACPASIQTPDDLATAGGPFAACAVAGRPGDFGTLESGYSWVIDPIEFDLQATARVHGARLSNPEANAGGSCNTTTMTCRAFQAYGWQLVPLGSTTITEVTVPPGYTLGWANVYFDGQPATAVMDLAAHSVTVKPPRGTQVITVQFINIVP